MEYSTDFLQKAHQYSFENKKQILASKMVGCFYCKRIYPAIDVADDDYILDKNAGTAGCPHCGTDSVIGDVAGIELSAEFLEAMNKYYFS